MSSVNTTILELMYYCNIFSTQKSHRQAGYLITVNTFLPFTVLYV